MLFFGVWGISLLGNAVGGCLTASCLAFQRQVCRRGGKKYGRRYSLGIVLIARRGTATGGDAAGLISRSRCVSHSGNADPPASTDLPPR